MIKIENVEVMGWEHAIRGMRNPKNSWDRMDTIRYTFGMEPEIGPNDHKLMTALANGGPVHAKYRRMITVYLDITAPLYWWKEFDTYKVGTVANSCSTMHKIHDKEFTALDISGEKLTGDKRYETDIYDHNGNHITVTPQECMGIVIGVLNNCRNIFLKDKNNKDAWWQMIQLLPSSYNQKRTIMLNYEVLVGMYEHRKSHKLDEWREFCKWVESLPYSELITGKFEAGGEEDGNGQK